MLEHKTFRLCTLLLCLIYTLVYFHYSATPGNNPAFPLGWWGWFDQGEYIKSARAFLNLDFSPAQHLYPPLYSALGALGLVASAGHPFFFTNLLLLLFSFYCFCRFASLSVSVRVAAVLFFASLVFNPTAFLQVVIPWTTTLSAALFSVVILSLTWVAEYRSGKNSMPIPLWKICLAGLCAGLIVPARPIDAVYTWPLCAAILLSWYWAPASGESRTNSRYKSLGLVCLLLSFACGPLMFLAFNYSLSGHPGGQYFQIASSSGMHFHDVGEKFFSLIINGERVYGEPYTGLLQRQPWILLFFIGIPFLFDKRVWHVSWLAATIILWFFIYLPFGDLLPTGLWRYYNIHYFTAAFPYIALVAFVALRLLWTELTAARPSTACLVKAAVGVLIGLCLLSIDFVESALWLRPKVDQSTIWVSRETSSIPTDYVDFFGVSAQSFESVYFPNEAVEVMLDGTRLVPVREYRLLPVGGGTRLVFITPKSWSTITLSLPAAARIESPIVKDVSLTLGFGAALLDTGVRKSYVHTPPLKYR